MKAADPDSGQSRTQKVTATFRHETERLFDITVADGGQLASTAGHNFVVYTAYPK
ncbi:hypothetical protein [Streptomyces sp. NPDC048272]|uniref:hypothetical protein n=1 Tax=Streptomyces sp. NPDC048272 TaxID=3154616 RepID=UPI0033DEC5BC